MRSTLHVEVARLADSLVGRIGTEGKEQGYHSVAEGVEVHFGLVGQIDVSWQAVLVIGMEQVMVLVVTLTSSSCFCRTAVGHRAVDLS